MSKAIKYATRGVVWGVLGLALLGWAFGGLWMLAVVWG